MPVSVTMPRLGESVSEGTVTRWLKKEGEHVDTDDPLLEVSTEKVDTEIPSPASGILQSISVGEDETVEVGAELGIIGEVREGTEAPAQPPQQTSGAAAPGQAPAQEPSRESPPPPPQPEPQPAAQAQPAPPDTRAPETPQPAEAQPEGRPEPQPEAPPETPETLETLETLETQPRPEEAGPAAAPYVTPLVRKLAAEHGIDLTSVQGTGVGGRIRKQDVLDAARTRQEPQARPQPEPAAAEQPAPAAPAAPPQAAPTAPPTAETAQVRGRTEKMSRMRSVIARRMTESLHTSAQLTTVVEVDVTQVARLRERAKADFEAREGVKLSFLPFFAQATVEALKAHPKLNASVDVDKGEITYYDSEHLGVAVDTERGLLVPVIHGAGDLNLGGLARAIADLAQRSRSGDVSPDEMSGGTFTVTNTGSRGAVFDTPIILQPQVGILGTCKVVKRPEVMEDPELGEVIATRSMANFALTYDHRLVDGADAARFLNTIKARLEEGNFEGELGLHDRD